MQFQTTHEKMCLDTATSFSAVRGFATNRTRKDFTIFGDALEYADKIGDGRTMLYAINDLGNSAHICNR